MGTARGGLDAAVDSLSQQAEKRSSDLPTIRLIRTVSQWLDAEGGSN
jgi:hypothetical protein